MNSTKLNNNHTIFLKMYHLMDKKFKRVDKKIVWSLRGDNFLLAKKLEIDWSIGRPERLAKTT